METIESYTFFALILLIHGTRICLGAWGVGEIEGGWGEVLES